MYPGIRSYSSPKSQDHKWGFWEQMCCTLYYPDKTGGIADFLSWFCCCCDQTERVMRARLPIRLRMELIDRFGSAIKAVPEKHSLFYALAHAALQGRQRVKVDDTVFALSQMLGVCIVTLSPAMQSEPRNLPYHVHRPAVLATIEAQAMIVLVYNGISHYGSITARPGITFASFCVSRGVEMQCSPWRAEEEGGPLALPGRDSDLSTVPLLDAAH